MQAAPDCPSEGAPSQSAAATPHRHRCPPATRESASASHMAGQSQIPKYRPEQSVQQFRALQPASPSQEQESASCVMSRPPPVVSECRAQANKNHLPRRQAISHALRQRAVKIGVCAPSPVAAGRTLCPGAPGGPPAAGSLPRCAPAPPPYGPANTAVTAWQQALSPY